MIETIIGTGIILGFLGLMYLIGHIKNFLYEYEIDDRIDYFLNGLINLMIVFFVFLILRGGYFLGKYILESF